ncbi:MAG: ROK family protein [Cytophagales bacterium]|nr:ROK family protein [Cytophagales bacterium]
MPDHDIIWGIDLGGTKAEGIVMGPGRTSEILFRDRVATGADKGYAHVLHQIQTLVGWMEKSVGVRPERIGIGTPGTRDKEKGLMRGCNSTCLNGRNMQEDLSELLGADVVIANDANCFALAEAQLGVVHEQFPNAATVFGIILGTGVGGGLVINGQVVDGLHGIAGEWGHNYLDDSGGPCYCGKTGCVERVLSGPALENYYHSISGIRKGLPEIYKLAKEGDGDAAKTIQRLTAFFGKAMSVVINILDPDVIVVGGGVGQIQEIYSDGMKEIGKYIFNNGIVKTPIVPPTWGDSAGVFGAAQLVAPWEGRK